MEALGRVSVRVMVRVSVSVSVRVMVSVSVSLSAMVRDAACCCREEMTWGVRVMVRVRLAFG